MPWTFPDWQTSLSCVGSQLPLGIPGQLKSTAPYSAYSPGKLSCTVNLPMTAFEFSNPHILSDQAT